MVRLVVIAAKTVGVLGALLLGGCGLKGDLDTPAPLWGDPNREIVERDLPSGESSQSSDIVFTRDDVDLFRDDLEEDDPFAEDEATGE